MTINIDDSEKQQESETTEEVGTKKQELETRLQKISKKLQKLSPKELSGVSAAGDFVNRKGWRDGWRDRGGFINRRG